MAAAANEARIGSSFMADFPRILSAMDVLVR
jgi:hypothetical protein